MIRRDTENSELGVGGSECAVGPKCHELKTPNTISRNGNGLAVSQWLHEAVRWRTFATAFMPPSIGWAQQLKGLVTELASADRATLNWVANEDEDRLAREHHVTIGHACRVSPCESEHVGDRLGGKGAIISDVSGFYRAFSFCHANDMREQPDHITVELSFLSWLALKAAYAQHKRKADALALCRMARENFLKDHLCAWLAYFAASLQEAAPVSFYTRLARCLVQRLDIPTTT